MGEAGSLSGGAPRTVEIVKPRRLHPGDTVAVLSPSWGGPAVFPHVYRRGLAMLREELGLRVEELPTATAEPEHLHRHPEARAEDVHRALADDRIAALVATIGGDDAVRVLPHLDAGLLRARPKILMGYSDTTSLLVWANLHGLVTFHGPTVMAGLSQLRAWPRAFADHLRTMLFEAPPETVYRPYAVWSEGYPDWADAASVGRANALHPNREGWRWVQGRGVAEGRLFGGCFEVLEMMKATPHWPDPGFWRGRILFLESSEEAPAPPQVERWLRNYGMQGVFDAVAGLLIGRPCGYTEARKEELLERVARVVAVEFGRPELPVVGNMDFGHTDPQLLLPLGITARIDCEARTVSLTEPALA